MKTARCSVLILGLIFLFGPSSAHAVELLYTFEGDSGTTVTDKLTGDGAQNGTIFQNVDPADTFTVPFGTQSGFFDLPEVIVVPRVSIVEIPDTIFSPDFNMTLAAFVNHDLAADRLVRVFSTFAGAGSTVDQLLLDFDTRAAAPYVRAIFDGTVIKTPTPPPIGIGTSGYHHYAVTVDSGAVSLYFDGAEVATGTLPAGYNYLHNIQIGEDRGGAPNEQLIGNVDEALVLQRALSASDIAQLASGMSVSSLVTPLAEERSVYYDFEGDSGTMFIDKFALDGGQNGIAQLDAVVDTDPANARLGNSSLHLDDPMVPLPIQHSVISAGALGTLGARFTLSATVNALDGGQTAGNIARVFSTYAGTGGTAGRMILDFNPNAVPGGTGVAGIGVRLILPDGTSLISDVAPALNENQTITAVYDLGEVTLYLNGTEIATKIVAPNTISLGAFNLHIGEDLAGGVNEQFVGNMDDLLIISRAFTPEQVASLHTLGAEATVAALPPLEEVITGDYNGDGVVDIADYTVWRDSLNATGAGLAADGSGDELIDARDHFLWKANFGTIIPLEGNAVASAVPEPSTLVLMAMFLLLGGLLRTHQTARASARC